MSRYSLLILSLAFACGADPSLEATPQQPSSTGAAPSDTSAPVGSATEGAVANDVGGEEPAATGSTAEPAAAAKPAGPRLSKEAAALLSSHNKYRARHCAAPLSWSASVASVAQKWADELVSRGCGFGHSGGTFGENLAAGTASVMGPEQAVTMWYDEISIYDFARGRFSMKTGHATQLLWKGTRELGCGTSTCNGMRIWVCNYAPAGNVMGEFSSNVLPATCSKK